MALIMDLKGLQERDEQIARAQEEREASKANWLTVADGETVELIPLQELDASSEKYSEKNGLGLLALEHKGQGDKFFLRILCTNDEDHEDGCWGCDKHRASYKENPDYKGWWRPQVNLYLNVLVRRKDKKGKVTEEVAVLQRARSKNSYVNQIIDFAVDEGFISGRLFKLNRKGKGQTDTTYTLNHMKDDAGVNVEDYELFDLSKLVREVPYAEQAKALGQADAAPKAADVTVDEDSDDDDWM